MRKTPPNLIDATSATPMYRQIAEYIYDQITSGILPPGSAVGSELVLQETFKVSRVTIRQAIGLLVRQGLVVRKQGKGTFVGHGLLDFPLDALEGTRERVASYGLPTSSKVVGFQTIKGSILVRRILALNPDELVTQIKRIDFADSKTLAFATIYLPEKLTSNLSEDALSVEALYPLLEQAADVVAYQAAQTIEAVGASTDVARRLKIPVGAPVLRVKRTTRDEENRPFEHSVVVFPAKAVQFSVSLRRRLGEVAPFSIEKIIR